MNIGVIGFRGRLGSELVNMGCLPIDCDVTHTGSIVNALEGNNLDCIVNCSGFTDVDLCEKELIKAYSINAFAPRNIIDCFRGKLVQISTDYIFNSSSKPHDEFSLPSPMNSYGNSKFVGEIGLRQFKNVLIIRTTILYNYKHQRGNFVKSVYNNLKQNKGVHLPELYGNPTHTRHLAEGIIKCIDNDYIGILNIAGDDYLSRYQMGKRIARKFGFDENLVNRGTAWGDAHRPQYLGLDTSRAKLLDVPIYTFDEGLDEFGREIDAEN